MLAARVDPILTAIKAEQPVLVARQGDGVEWRPPAHR